MNPAQWLEAILHHDIPLTQAMDLQVLHWQNRELQLLLPLQGNSNHTQSMFGGSLYSAAVLAGWGWLRLRQQEAGLEEGHIVIQEGNIEYPLPVISDAHVICPPPTEAAWERFEKLFRRRGRSRLQLDTYVMVGDQTAAHFCGQYVLYR